MASTGGLSEDMLKVINGQVTSEEKLQNYNQSLQRCVTRPATLSSSWTPLLAFVIMAPITVRVCCWFSWWKEYAARKNDEDHEMVAGEEAADTHTQQGRAGELCEEA